MLLNSGTERRNEVQIGKIHECNIHAFTGITDAALSIILEKLTVAHSINKLLDFIKKPDGSLAQSSVATGPFTEPPASIPLLPPYF